MTAGNQVNKTNTAPPVPARPNEQPYFVQQRYPPTGYSPYGPPVPFGGAAQYYGFPGSHNPMLSNMNQIDDIPFQSIHSVVQAISSISMMLESTYVAVHSSFRAVMDVADHFIRLSDSLSGVMSLMTIMNTIKWFFRRILYMFNMVSEDQIWSDSLSEASETIKKGQQSIFEHSRSEQSSWPMLMFLGVAIGAPYMMYQFQKPAPTSSKWLTQEDCHYTGEALYDFNTNRESEIPLKAGQKVIIAPKEQQPKVSNWLLATTDGKKSGLIPMNYVANIKFVIVDKNS